MRRTAIPVALMAAIVLALLSAGAVLAHHTYQPFPGQDTQVTDGNDTLTGTSADESWTGSLGNDTIRGEGGMDVFGVLSSSDPSVTVGDTQDPGADTYNGGRGTDILDGRGDGSVDRMDCGDGAEDLASYEKGSATGPPTVTDRVNKTTCERLDWTDEHLADCANRPWDNADVVCKTGTNGRDTLIGRDSADIRIVDAMWGKGGNDTLRGRRGFDGLEGGAGQDTLYGGSSPDALFGYLYGESDGAPPSGVPPDETNPDRVYGEAGDDHINVRDLPSGSTDQTQAGRPDIVSCGAGAHDWAVIDIGVDTDPQGVLIRNHGQAGCEQVSSDSCCFKGWWGPRKRHR